MAKLTPETILRLSEPVEQVYSNIVDSLLVNMAKHFNSGYSLSTQQWEIRKLAEMGQLNKESVEIIASLTGQNKELITAALENAVYMAAKDIEPELKRAVKKGAIQNAAADNVLASQSIIQSLQAYEQQALEKMNLVNTTMLESTLAQYRKIITNTAAVERQMQAVQQTLNIAAGKVITGAESRQQALRQSLSQVHKEGITGFYDRAGRKWSPEAYVNMDIRTTVHNTAIEAVKIRQQDYGVNIFRVSQHSGARPLCYPYQGRYFHGIIPAVHSTTEKENNTGIIPYPPQATESLPDYSELTAAITRSRLSLAYLFREIATNKTRGKTTALMQNLRNSGGLSGKYDIPSKKPP